MSQSQKTIIFLVLCAISISVLYWCQNNKNTDNTNLTDQSISQDNLQNIQKLVINNWCIWCGKCTIIAPESFEMKWWVAIVSTQDNISTQTTKNALKYCPVSVIKIIEA